jgi:hypothetical protein
MGGFFILIAAMFDMENRRQHIPNRRIRPNTFRDNNGKTAFIITK